MLKKPFKFLISVRHYAECINKIYNFSRYNFRFGKTEELKYSHLKRLSFYIEKGKSIFKVNF